jgi:hypothetical protein
MSIPPIVSGTAGYRGAAGLAATGQAIRRGQEAFDARADRIVAETAALADPESAADSAALTGEVVGLQTDRVVNSILFAVFRAQAEQQREAADLVRADRG